MFYRVNGGVNIPGFHTLPPILPILARLELSNSTGLEERTVTDSLITSPFTYPILREFYLQENDLTDSTVESIFKILSPAYRESLMFLYVFTNRLTRVPNSLPEIFPRLSSLSSTDNNISGLKNGSLTFTNTRGPFVFLANNAIDSIEPGTFENGKSVIYEN